MSLKRHLALFLIAIMPVLGFSQVDYSDALLFDFGWSGGQTGVSGSSWTSAELGADKTKIIITSALSDPQARSKFGYGYALKCSSIEINSINSLGKVVFAIQNGSGGNIATYTVQIWNGAGWVTTETLSLDGNAALEFSPVSVVTKSAARIKISSSNSSWFYGVKVYNHKNKGESNPKLLSITPQENTEIPALGEVALTFDEYIKQGIGSITFGTGTISSANFSGNQLKINYTNLADGNHSLIIAASAIQNYAGNGLSEQISKSFTSNSIPPVVSTVSPANGATILVSDQSIEGNKIKITFDKNIVLGTGTVTFNGAKVFCSATGNVLTIGYVGLPYNSQNNLIIPASYIKDQMGLTLVNDIHLTYITGTRDNTAPKLTDQSVSDNAINQPIGGSFTLTFDEPVFINNSINITANGKPITLSNNANIVGVYYNQLPYNSDIELVIPANAISDSCDNAYAGKVIKFKTKAKAGKDFNFIVAKDGTGNYTTIQAAINAVSNNSANWTLIYIKPGTYKEKIYIPAEKTKISLIGENPENTIISWSECSSIATHPPGTSNPGTSNSYTMLIAAPEFYAENLSIRNDYDYPNGQEVDKQAVALEHTNDKHVFKNCKLYSYQDTHYPRSANHRQYFLNCLVQGGTDFVFGSGTTFFDNCQIKCIPGGSFITAAASTDKEFGLVFANCQLNYATGISMGNKGQFYLARPWKVNAKTAFVNSIYENGLIRPEGWSIWGGNENHLSAKYEEYNNKLAGGALVDVSKRANWTYQLTTKQAVRYNPENAFNFGANNSWNPKAYLTAPAAPLNLTIDLNGNMSWSESEYGVGYLIFKNGSLVGKTTNCSYTINNYTSGDTYTVKALNEYGALSDAAQVTGKNETMAGEKKLLNCNLVDQVIVIKDIHLFNKVSILSMNGQLMKEIKNPENPIDISFLFKGNYLIQATSNDNKIITEQFIKK